MAQWLDSITTGLKARRGMGEADVLAAISEKGAQIDAAARAPEEPWYRRLASRRRTKMRYLKRMLIALAVMSAGLVAYVASFVTGTPAGAQWNAWTDGVLASCVSGAFGFVGAVAHTDLSRPAQALTRVLTLGPASYVIACAVAGFVVAGIVAAVYSRWATAKTLDDGTPNFQAE